MTLSRSGECGRLRKPKTEMSQQFKNGSGVTRSLNPRSPTIFLLHRLLFYAYSNGLAGEGKKVGSMTLNRTLRSKDDVGPLPAVLYMA